MRLTAFQMIPVSALMVAILTGCPVADNAATPTAASKSTATTKSATTGAGSMIPNCSSANQIGCITTERFISSDSEATPPPSETPVVKTIRDFLVSLSHHNKFAEVAGKQVTLATEHGMGVAAKPSGYRDVPRYSKDNYGDAGSGNVNHVKRNSATEWDAGVPRKICGKAATSINAKIADCDARHTGARPLWDLVAGDGALVWDGAVHGNASEGAWTLVTIYHPTALDGDVCDSTCAEVWRDDRTGYLWSDQIKNGATTTFNWCHASGANNNSKSGNPYAEDDPADFCDNATYQVQTYVDGNAATLPVSLCTEDASFLSTPTWTNDAKGNMRLNSVSAPVRWRLPTKQDMSLGYIVNGGYYVLPSGGPNYWGSSLRGGNSGVAWYFDSLYGFIYGQFGSYNRSQLKGVRCVGRP